MKRQRYTQEKSSRPFRLHPARAPDQGLAEPFQLRHNRGHGGE
jgi:hypothetical protein